MYTVKYILKRLLKVLLFFIMIPIIIIKIVLSVLLIPIEYPIYIFSYFYKDKKDKYYIGITKELYYKVYNYIKKNNINVEFINNHKMYYLKYLPLTSPVRKRLLKMEQSVLDNASTVLAVTPLVQDDFRRRTSTPVAMITNGYDEDDFVGPVESDGLFNIVHTGLFAEDGNPLTLWKVLGKKVAENPEFKEKMRLRLVGKVDGAVMEAIEAEGLKDNVVNLGYKAHEVAVREQRAASLLILPLRNDPDYRPILPGKLFEYLAARRPILGIGQEDGAMARLLDEIALPGRIVSNWDNEERTRSFIDSVWSDYLEKGDTLLPPDGIDRFSRRSLTKELSHLLESQVSSK